jgi:hypothetical protein
MHHYLIYKITNTIDGKIYIGKHKTNNVDDDYMGSGKYLHRAIRKYGIENFMKEILFQFDNEADMNAKEAELVTEEFCLREDTYNIALGGKGGWDVTKSKTAFSGKTHSIETRKKLAEASRNRVASEETREKIRFHNRTNEKRKESLSRAFAYVPKSDEHKQNISNGLKEYFKNNPGHGPKNTKGIKKPIILCPHCGKSGSPNNMSRWHFENCKNKE